MSTLTAVDGETEIQIGKLDIDEDHDPRSIERDGDGGGSPPREPPPAIHRRRRGKPDRPSWERYLTIALLGTVLLLSWVLSWFVSKALLDQLEHATDGR